MTALILALLILLTLTAVFTVMAPRIIIAAIGLAVVSGVLAVIMYVFGYHWAAVLELSVCAGLITVVFISAISLTAPATKDEEKVIAKKKLMRFAPLPIIVAALGVFLWSMLKTSKPELVLANVAAGAVDFRNVMWETRALDLIGQIFIILVGVFGVVVLFKRLAEKKGE